ncbi:MAG: hypothetical protein D6725_05860 [Planctomycetota bacterium]|nr:MAG: hypothetical protein D6725_05860 [Planctomycetota bacterium]
MYRRTSDRAAPAVGQGPQTTLWHAVTEVRQCEPAALIVPPRIVRRMIKLDRELPYLGLRVPHSDSLVVSRATLLRNVEPEEVDGASLEGLPERVLLLARPGDRELAGMTAGELLLRLSRQMVHARVHAALEDAIQSKRLKPRDVRRRIDQLGQVAFDEAVAVLRSEERLFDDFDAIDAYCELAATFIEQRTFVPHWLPVYFPSLPDADRVAAIIGQDIDIERLAGAERLPASVVPIVQAQRAHVLEGFADWARTESSTAAVQENEAAQLIHEFSVAKEALGHVQPNSWHVHRYLRQAAQRLERGNTVGAAVCRMAALAWAFPADWHAIENLVLECVQELRRRLCRALALPDEEAHQWDACLAELLVLSIDGFWNHEKRLLYDLQAICVDFERPVHQVDLIGWLRTFGRRPLQRPLPNQQLVQMTKRLQRSMRRLSRCRVSTDRRRRLQRLLSAALVSTERQMRQRFRPMIEDVLESTGFVPDVRPEIVARRKLTEELLDIVAEHGLLTFGNLRDAIARNQLKLPDVGGVVELLLGDRLLRANRLLGERLEGVYQRAPFYLRWLQRLSSLAFGTRTGRFLTRFVVLPYGGAFVVLEGLSHLLGLFHVDNQRLRAETTLVAVGTLILLLMHAHRVREGLVRVLWSVARWLRRLGIEWPQWLLESTGLRRLLRSRWTLLFRRTVFDPLLLTVLICWGGAAVGWLPSVPNVWWQLAMWIALSLLLNSRVGRDVEEVTSEWIALAWRQACTAAAVLFEAVMTTFKRLLEGLERLLYAVDEWLRFRTGESTLTLALKAVLGVGWAAVSYVVTFATTLLIEPQINPIKHFPVVTVSHKILLPMAGPLSKFLAPSLGTALAGTAAGAIVFVTPGMFGFLVWELKSNWRLYAANRPRELRPVLVGPHGETMIRLMKPGFHSGTLPKLYHRLRWAVRHGHPDRPDVAEHKYRERLAHLQEAVSRFCERELLGLLRVSRRFGGVDLSVESVRVASNNIRFRIASQWPDGPPCEIAFQEQSGFLLACVLDLGWLRDCTPEQRCVFATALAGFYKLAGVDLVREQIEKALGPHHPPYDIREHWLVVWPDAAFETEVRYDLSHRGEIKPSPRSAAEAFLLPVLHGSRLFFRDTPLTWQWWVEFWEAESLDAIPSPPPPHCQVLPDPSADPQPLGS